MRALILATGLMLFGTAALAQPVVQERLKAIQADPASVKLAVDAGRKASFFCANCHGENGISKTPDVPNLAGQNPAYILEQMRKFVSGERKDPFMQGLIKVLKEDERMQVALFYASATVPPSVADAAQTLRGKELFGKLCIRCHGEQARGNAEIPRIAGQKLTYLQSTIMRYRDGTGIRSNQSMSIATAPLKNEDVVAVANYLTQLH